MDSLDEAREKINGIDEKMRELFLQRMDAVRQVSEYKITHGLPTLDPVREEKMIQRNASYVKDERMRNYYIEFLQNNMAVSRHFQDELKDGLKVAFSGVYGAFAHVAARKIYGEEANLVPCGDFQSAFESVVKGECQCAVLPIENSTAGEVGGVMDLLFSGSLYITGVYDLYIHQHLMAKPGTDIKDIKKVISHPQALAQCAGYLREKGFEQEDFVNTAVAAKFVKESNDRTIAAVAGEETAKLYGLEILDRNINGKDVNTTRFATVARVRRENPMGRDRHSILMFTVANRAGALAEAINIIGGCGYNMRCLRSRPMKDLLWKYYFYVEIEDNLDSDKGREMVEKLRPCCDIIKNLGSFKFPAELH